MTRYTWRTATLEIVMILVALIAIAPIYILVNIAFRPPQDASLPWLPTPIPTIDNFSRAWIEADLGRALVSSLAITTISVALIVVLAAFASYPLARLTSRLSAVAYWGLMLGLLLPFQIGLIPLYQTIRDLGLLGTWWSVIIFYIGLNMPFTVFLYTGFLRGIPREYEEAAWVDGARPLRAFWSIVFPMLRPVTGTVVILNSIIIWNDFLTPLLYLSGSDSGTVPVVLFRFVAQYISDWPLVFAGLIIASIPVLLVYFALQRWVIQGFAGGLKG